RQGEGRAIAGLQRHLARDRRAAGDNELNERRRVAVRRRDAPRGAGGGDGESAFAECREGRAVGPDAVEPDRARAGRGRRERRRRRDAGGRRRGRRDGCLRTAAAGAETGKEKHGAERTSPHLWTSRTLSSILPSAGGRSGGRPG